MAQRPIDPYAEFGEPIQGEDDPFAEFGSPIESPQSPTVAPVVSAPTADEILRDAATALEGSEHLAPKSVETPMNLNPPQSAERGFLDFLTSPLSNLASRAASKVADVIDAPTGIEAIDSFQPLAMARGFAAGTAKGVGEAIDSLTSPADLAATLLTGGAGLAARQGLRSANALRRAAQVANAVPIAHGASEISEGNVAPGIAEMALGSLGMGTAKATPTPVAKVADDFIPSRTELPPIKEAEDGLLAIKDYEFDARPDSMPDLESYIVTNNQATPNRGLNNRRITHALGTAEVTNNAGETIRRPLTAIAPVVRANNQNTVSTVTKAVSEAVASGKPVRENMRVSPNEVVTMPEKPVPTGNPEVDAITWKDYISLPRAIQSAYDLSFPFRQGLGLIHTKGWWQAWPDMIKSVGSEDAYKAVIASIKERPNYRIQPNGTSFAEEAGLHLTDLGKLSRREEELGSKIAEKIPGIRASNRAYTAFANKLRADNFDRLIAQAEASGLNPKQNLPLAKEIAKFVNNASGRGSLGSLEESLVTLNQVLFSPRLMASRLQMLNPKNYAFGNPQVRREYLKSALALGSMWAGMSEIAKLGGAETNNDPSSSDFRQIKIGDTRIDPSGGFRPYIVLGSRLAEVFSKDKERYTGKYGARDPKQDVADFIANKFAPLFNYAASPWLATEKFPRYMGDETLKLFVPIIAQDIAELYDSGGLEMALGVSPLSAVGYGTNSYPSGREPDEPFIDEAIGGINDMFGAQIPKVSPYDLRFPRR